jgi:general stress protein 26
MTREEIESLLKTAKIARFCSLNKDGTIHAAPVWYSYENGEIIIATPETSRKVRNVKRNCNVTILIDTSEVEAHQAKGVMVYGKAKVDDWTPLTPELMSLLERYMPKSETEPYARALFKLAKWVKITIKPERTGSFDSKKDEAAHRAIRETK